MMARLTLKYLFCALFFALMCLNACSQGDAKCTSYRAKVVKTYPHDMKAYTQGLFFWKGTMYESTGLNGSSSLRKVDLATGKVQARKNFTQKYFGEGSCVVDGMLYMLTWTNKVAFVYDASTLEYVKTYAYPREGWGLASIPAQEDQASRGASKTAGANAFDGACMVASDGSGTLYFLDREFQTRRSLKVTLNGKPVRLLNELEWVGDRIWANVYTTDLIFIINPKTGVVEGRVDCSGLYPASKRHPGADVLNGIAVNEKGQIFLTGKNWPHVYQIELEAVK